MTRYLTEGASIKSKSRSSHPVDKPTRDNFGLDRSAPDFFTMLQGTIGNRRTGGVFAKARPDYPVTCAPGSKQLYEISRKTMNLDCPESCDQKLFDKVIGYNKLPIDAKRPQDLADHLMRLSDIIVHIINISYNSLDYGYWIDFYSNLYLSASNEFAYVARQLSSMVESNLDSAITRPESYSNATAYQKLLYELYPKISENIRFYLELKTNPSIKIYGDYFPKMNECYNLLMHILDYELLYIKMLFKNYAYLSDTNVREIEKKHNIVFSLDPSTYKLESSLTMKSGDCFNFNGTAMPSGYAIKNYICRIRIADFKSKKFIHLLKYLREKNPSADLKSASRTPICLLDHKSLKDFQKYHPLQNIYIGKNHIILNRGTRDVFSNIESCIKNNHSKQAPPSSSAPSILPYEFSKEEHNPIGNPGLLGHPIEYEEEKKALIIC